MMGLGKGNSLYKKWQLFGITARFLGCVYVKVGF